MSRSLRVVTDEHKRARLGDRVAIFGLPTDTAGWAARSDDGSTGHAIELVGDFVTAFR